MQNLGPFCLQPLADRGPHSLWDGRHIRQAAGQGLEVKASAPDDDGKPPLVSKVCQKRPHLPATSHRSSSSPAGRDMTVELVRDASHLLRARTGGDHLQRVIDLHAVCVDHHAIVRSCKGECQRGLCRWRSAGYQDRVIVLARIFHHGHWLPRLSPIRQNPVLTPALAEKAADAVASSRLYWLADGIACDIPLPDGTDALEADRLLREVVASHAVDVAVQDAETRRKSFLIADMDSTKIGQNASTNWQPKLASRTRSPRSPRGP